MPHDGPSLLQDIYQVGESMIFALESGDLDRFFSLVEERGTLLEALGAYTAPSHVAPGWQDTADALASQHVRLGEAAAGREKELGRALAAAERYKDARKQYTPAPQPSRILHRNLSV